MDHHDLTGYYTYRSLLNRQEPVDDLNQIRFAEGELFLYVVPDGVISGTLAFPADPLADTKDFMDITGRVTGWAPPTVELEGLGRPGTATESFNYKYQGSLAPAYPDAVRQRPAFVGTVLRAEPHGNASAGFTASFVAVERDFLQPKQISGVALIPESIDMLSSRSHRLQHAVWHTVRVRWHRLKGDASAVAEIEKRGWWPNRPPFLETGGLDLENGAGEDFLYMHRKMILMVKEVYADAGKPPPAGWMVLPSANAPQTVYKATTGSNGGAFDFDPDASGFMVPPPVRDDGSDPARSDRMFKSPSFLGGVMSPMQRFFRSTRLLSGLTLGQLGNLLEFTIHGWMHLRWAHTVYDPESGEPIGRPEFDIDPRWDDPSNDDLGDFYSSHVHPTFWRLHGWIDDRINDWAMVNADRIQPATVDDVPWFAADGQLILVDEPFYWPTHGHHHPGGGEAEVRAMEEVMEIMKNVLAPEAVAAPSGAETVARPKLAKEVFREILLGVTVPDSLER